MNQRWILYSLLGLLLLTGCNAPSAQAQVDFSARPIRAVATTGMIADLVSNIGRQHVQVDGLMGPGVDPHLFKPSERDVISLADADIIFYNGLHLEAQMGRVFERMQGRVRAVAVSDGIDRTRLAAPPEFEGNYDPHIWFDVSLWRSAAETVRQALTQLDPIHAADYQANADRYQAELQALEDYLQEQVAAIPAERRVLITAHDAFNYFGKAYGFQVRGLQGISTASETGAADIQNLAEFIVTHRIPAIFVESSVPPRTIEAVQAAVQARGFEVKIGGQLYSDALGSPDSPAGTYIGMVRANMDTLRAALSTPAPLGE